MNLLTIIKDKTRKLNRKFLAFSLELIGVFLVTISLFYDLIFEFTSDLGFGKVQIAGLVLGLITVICAGLIDRSDPVSKRIWNNKLPSIILFFIGLLLLVINIVGLFIPQRNPAVYENLPFAGKNRSARYTAEQVQHSIQQNPPTDSSRKEYVRWLTDLIFDGTVHYWEADTNNAFHTRMPIHENYLLFIINAIQNQDTQYEFCDSDRAIQRCASVCSQSSRILADILNQQKIQAHILTLDGHVVVRAQVEKNIPEWWILDGDYGVVIEHDLDDIEKDLDLARAAYQKEGYTDSVVNSLVTIYGSDGNATIEKRVDCTRENNTYTLKWLIPLVAMLPFSLLLGLEWVLKIFNKD